MEKDAVGATDLAGSDLADSLAVLLADYSGKLKMSVDDALRGRIAVASSVTWGLATVFLGMLLLPPFARLPQNSSAAAWLLYVAIFLGEAYIAFQCGLRLARSVRDATSTADTLERLIRSASQRIEHTDMMLGSQLVLETRLTEAEDVLRDSKSVRRRSQRAPVTPGIDAGYEQGSGPKRSLPSSVH